MLTPSLVLAYWMRGSMAGILYASGLSLSRCHHHQTAAVTPGGAGCGSEIVRPGGAGVNGALANILHLTSNSRTEGCGGERSRLARIRVTERSGSHSPGRGRRLR